MTLTEFLLARIAEDEAVAREAMVVIGDNLTEYRNGPCSDLSHHSRVLAECEAKRRIVNDHERWSQRAGTDAVATSLGIRISLLHLTLPYADHPDYRDEWRP